MAANNGTPAVAESEDTCPTCGQLLPEKVRIIYNPNYIARMTDMLAWMAAIGIGFGLTKRTGNHAYVAVGGLSVIWGPFSYYTFDLVRIIRRKRRQGAMWNEQRLQLVLLALAPIVVLGCLIVPFFS